MIRSNRIQKDLKEMIFSFWDIVGACGQKNSCRDDLSGGRSCFLALGKVENQLGLKFCLAHHGLTIPLCNLDNNQFLLDDVR